MKKTMPFWILAVVLALTPLFNSGCSPAETTPGENEAEERGEEISYQEWENLAEVPEEVRINAELISNRRGFFVFTPEDYETEGRTFIMVSAGEKPTAGYEIQVENVEKTDGVLRIQVKETSPGEDEMTAQILTYPLVLVELSRQFEEYLVVDAYGEELERINPQEIPSIFSESGTYTGQVDSNFLEIKLDGEPQVFMYSEDLSWIFAELLNSGDEVVFSFFVNEQGQKVLLDIDTAERAQMSRGVSGTYRGIIDSTFIEIEMEGEAKTFAVAEQVLLTDFQEGDEIIFDYFEDRQGRLVVNKMGKTN